MLDRYSPSGPAVRDVSEGASLHSQDMRPPVIVLGQAQSEGVAAGMFQRTDTQEEFPTLQVVPLVVRPSRLKWPAGKFSRDMQPECWSDDGLVGSSRPIKDIAPLFPGAPCHSCEHFTAEPWAVDKDQGWCMPGYNVLLMDATSYEVYLMRLRGSAAKIARMLVAKGIFQHAVVELSSDLAQTATGTWYQLKARTVRRLDEDDQSLVASMYKDFAASAVEGTDVPGDEMPEDSKLKDEYLAKGGLVPQGASFEITLRGESELRYTASGKAVCNIMAETPQGYMKVVAWEALAERLARDVEHGYVLRVTGKYGTRAWQGRDGREMKEPNLTIQTFQVVRDIGTDAPTPTPTPTPISTPSLPEDLPF